MCFTKLFNTEILFQNTPDISQTLKHMINSVIVLPLTEGVPLQQINNNMHIVT